MRWTSVLVLFLGLFLVSAQEGSSITDEQLEIWQDSDMTTSIWKLIHSHDNGGLKELIEKEPKAILLRSADGRGALFWAYEYGNEAAVQLLLQSGCPADAKDSKGLSPADMTSAPVDDDAYEE